MNDAVAVKEVDAAQDLEDHCLLGKVDSLNQSLLSCESNRGVHRYKNSLDQQQLPSWCH